jgi:hypothetical protein
MVMGLVHSLFAPVVVEHGVPVTVHPAAQNVNVSNWVNPLDDGGAHVGTPSPEIDVMNCNGGPVGHVIDSIPPMDVPVGKGIIPAVTEQNVGMAVPVVQLPNTVSGAAVLSVKAMLGVLVGLVTTVVKRGARLLADTFVTLPDVDWSTS